MKSIRKKVGPRTEEEYAAIMERFLDAVEAMADVQRDVADDITYDQIEGGNLPIALAFWGDFHVGSVNTNYSQMRQDIKDMAEFRLRNPGAVRLIGMGDYLDGYQTDMGRASSGLYEEVVTRPDQQEAVFLYLAKQVGQWDEMILGCHLAWELTKAGRDPMQHICKELGAKNAGYGLFLDVVVGEETYRVCARHRAPSESKVNSTTAQRNLDDNLGMDTTRADVIAIAHLHHNDLQVKERAGRKVVYLRSGSYKAGDGYARAIGATMQKTNDAGIPLVIFFPDEHRTIPFYGADWREGLVMLEHLREQYKNRSEYTGLATAEVEAIVNASN